MRDIAALAQKVSVELGWTAHGSSVQRACNVKRVRGEMVGGSGRRARRGYACPRWRHLSRSPPGHEITADDGHLLSFEIVEVNSVIDEHNRTAELAVELALSAFGKKIL
jgi:hypothetical protein